MMTMSISFSGPSVIFMVLAAELNLLGFTHSQPGIELTTDPRGVTDRDTLRTGQGLCSENGDAVLVVTEEGNLVLYDIIGGPGRQRVIWTPGVYETARRSLLLATDGELIFFDESGNIAWRSGFHGPTNTLYFAYIVSTGDFVVTNDQDIIVWNAGSFFFQLDKREKNIKVVVPKGWPDVQYNIKDEDDRRRGCTGWQPY